jgi:hypothetical protein
MFELPDRPSGCLKRNIHFLVQSNIKIVFTDNKYCVGFHSDLYHKNSTSDQNLM